MPAPIQFSPEAMAEKSRLAKRDMFLNARPVFGRPGKTARVFSTPEFLLLSGLFSWLVFCLGLAI